MSAAPYLAFPFRVAAHGGIALADQDEHIRQRIEQILFTAPGERVMQPTFGSGVRKLIFGPAGPVLAAAAEFTIARSLQTELARVIMVNGVEVTVDQETVVIGILYTRVRDLAQERVVFRAALAGGAQAGVVP